MEPTLNEQLMAPGLTDEELVAILAKETFVTTDEAEETDAEKVIQ